MLSPSLIGAKERWQLEDVYRQ